MKRFTLFLKMKFLTDENIASFVVNNIRKKGFDIKDIKEEQFYGFDDKKILELANNENRIIITHDKDFAEIVSNKKHNGIILIKSKNQKPEYILDLLMKS